MKLKVGRHLRAYTTYINNLYLKDIKRVRNMRRRKKIRENSRTERLTDPDEEQKKKTRKELEQRGLAMKD